MLIFMIFAFIILITSGIFIYIGTITNAQLHTALDDSTAFQSTTNTSEVIEDTFGKVPTAFSSLYWISIVIIAGMIISIFVGSYLVTTKPIFLVPYIFTLVIAVIVSVGISNAYESLITTPELATTFAGFTASNYFMLYLPMWVTIIGFIGAIIMFSRIGSKEDRYIWKK